MQANILITGDRRACIADFGLSTITGVAIRTDAWASQVSLVSNDTLMSFTGGGTRRWTSPELLDPERFGISESEDNRPTRQSDCYALGMVIYEVGVQASGFLLRRTNQCAIGIVRAPPLSRDPVGHSSSPCDSGRGSAKEAGGGESTRIKR